MAEITEADVMQALQGVQDPELNKDFTELGMIRDVRASHGVVSLTVVLTTPACPLKDEIGNRVRGALTERIPGVTAVNIDFGPWLGLGQHVVEMDAKNVRYIPDKNIVLIRMTKAAVQKLPEVKS